MPGRRDHQRRWGVILSGGDGMRLRPLTRLLTGDDRPKQFCRLIGDRTLLRETRDRVARMVRPDRTLFVLTKSHEPFYTGELADVPPQRMIVQPINRGTLPAILWTLTHLTRLDQQAVVAFFPSDHHYVHEGKFVDEVASAFEAAEAVPRVILLGAPASSPAIDYGWIEPDRLTDGSKLFQVKRFREKPPSEVAQELLEQGCLWNTFVMVGRVHSFLELIQSAACSLYETFQAAVEQHKGEANPELMQAIYAQIGTADFSRVVLSQTTEKLAVLSLGDVGWDDLGHPDRVSAVRAQMSPRKPASQALISEVAVSAAVAG
ncbi:MAG: sugar phosphate nucleotidyltransferase [Acidobacteriota bacterium]